MLRIPQRERQFYVPQNWCYVVFFTFNENRTAGTPFWNAKSMSPRIILLLFVQPNHVVWLSPESCAYFSIKMLPAAEKRRSPRPAGCSPFFLLRIPQRERQFYMPQNRCYVIFSLLMRISQRNRQSGTPKRCAPESFFSCFFSFAENP